MIPVVLDLAWSRAAGRATVAVSGDLDRLTADRLLADVTAVTTEPGVTRVVLDCAELSFCDSHGLAVLLTIHRRTNAAGIALVLDNRQQRLDRLLAITGTAALLTGTTSQARSQS